VTSHEVVCFRERHEPVHHLLNHIAEKAVPASSSSRLVAKRHHVRNIPRLPASRGASDAAQGLLGGCLIIVR
jgi:hypothetical protein